MLGLSLIIGLLPGLTWLWFYMKEDGKPEPVAAVIRAFIAGSAAAFAALGVQLLVRGEVYGDNVGLNTSDYAFVFAFIEELAKFVAAYVAVRFTKAFDEPMDAILYPIIAALGFASVENVAVAYTLIAGGSIGGAFEVMTLRFVGATLVHSVASGTLGYFWGRYLLKANRGYGALIGLAAATALHGTFNILILSFGNTTYTFAFLVGAVLLVLFDFREMRSEEEAAGIRAR
jgi:protease PrsW